MNIFKKAATLMGALALAVFGVLTMAPSASATASPDAPPANQRFEFQRVWGDGEHGALCLGVQGGSSNNGAAVIQWECNGNSDQRWFTRRSYTGYVEIVNVNSGKCLDVPGGSTSAGTGLIQWDCKMDGNQLWYFNNVTGGKELHNYTSGINLDMPGGSEAWGTQAVQWPWNGGWNQRWFTMPV
ncbi:RICIN domain-containing protein [Embleya sp. AB8]|uniref:RICIN domain-containing protein n=1 Tax=Embleya sp. AB8 TaxID=3156304 RepID=UPI003C75782C